MTWCMELDHGVCITISSQEGAEGPEVDQVVSGRTCRRSVGELKQRCAVSFAHGWWIDHSHDEEADRSELRRE